MPFIVAALPVAIGAIGTFLASSAFITTIASVGIGVAASYLLGKLLPKPAATSEQPTGVSLQRQYGTDVPRQVACGLIGTAGHDTFLNTWSTANSAAQQVYTLSDYPSTALTRVSINGKYATLGAEDANLGFVITSGDFANLIWVKFLNGRQTTALSELVAHANPPERWTANGVGFGQTAVLVTMLYDKDKNSSFPDFFFEFKGAPLYDWRKDSTVGGSGSHRWADTTTHEYTANPIVIEYNYRRGLSVNGDLFCGMGMPASDLPLDKFTNAANICDEAHPSDGQPRYRVSVNLNCMSTHSDNLNALSLACGSMQIDAVNGSWPLVGSNQTTVMTFTDADIIDSADFKYSEKRSMSELVNAVSGNYPDPEQLWSMVGYVPQISPTAITVDRRTRDIAIDFAQVPYARQAAQLASIYLYENRYEARATVTLRPRFQVLEAGDWVLWQSARYGTKTYIVIGVTILSLDSGTPRNVVLTLQQRDGSIYAGIAPPIILPPSRPSDPVYLTEVQNFQLLASSVLGFNGAAAPAIRVSWLAITDPTVTDVEIVYYPTAQPAAAQTKIVKADTSVVTLSSGIVSNTQYTVQARLITDPPRITAFNTGAVVNTLNIAVRLEDFNAATRFEIDKINGFYDTMRDIEQRIAAIASRTDARQFLQTKQLRTQLGLRSDAAFAGIEEVRTVAIGVDAALAAYKLVVTATFNNVNTALGVNAAKIAVNAQAIADANSAFAAYQIDVAASFGSLNNSVALNTASINLNAQAIADANTAFATYKTTVTASFGSTNAAVSTNASAISTLNGFAAASYGVTLDVNGYASGFKLVNGGGGLSSTTFLTDAFQVAKPGVSGGAAVPIFTIAPVNGVTKIGIRADMFIDGGITASALNVGFLSAISANLGNVTVGTLVSPSGKVNFDLTNGRLIISD